MRGPTNRTSSARLPLFAPRSVTERKNGSSGSAWLTGMSEKWRPGCTEEALLHDLERAWLPAEGRRDRHRSVHVKFCGGRVHEGQISSACRTRLAQLGRWRMRYHPCVINRWHVAVWAAGKCSCMHAPATARTNQADFVSPVRSFHHHASADDCAQHPPYKEDYLAARWPDWFG